MVGILYSANLDLFSEKSTVQLWAGGLSFAVLIVLVSLVRQKKLKASYSLLWFASWAVCTTVISYPYLMDQISQKLGIYYSPTLLLLFILFSLGLITLHITIVLTRLTRHVNLLTQEISLLKEKDQSSCAD